MVRQLLRFQPADWVASNMLDAQRLEPCAVAQAAARQVRGALQHTFGQRWPFIGQVRFITDQDQAPGVAFFAQGQCRTATGVTGANDDQGLAHISAVTASSTRPASTRTG